jgi:hypothetical protein
MTVGCLSVAMLRRYAPGKSTGPGIPHPDRRNARL